MKSNFILMDLEEIEWSLSSTLRKTLTKLYPILVGLHQKLTKGGHISEETEHEFNDCDNHSWATTVKKTKIIILKDQNCKFFVEINEAKKQFTVYRYYSEYDEDCIVNAWGCTTPAKFCEQADLMLEAFTDELQGNQYISRPTLQRLINVGLDRYKSSFKNAWNEKCSISYYPCIEFEPGRQKLDGAGKSFFHDVIYTGNEFKLCNTD